MSKIKKNTIVILSFLLISILLLTDISNIPVSHAKEQSTIKLKYILSENEFKIYKIFSITNNDYILEKQFKDYPINFEDMHIQKNKVQIATALASYIKKDRLKETKKEKTNLNCEAIIRGLDKGIYLLLGESKIKDNYLYKPNPILLEINDSTNYKEIRMDLKYQKSDIKKPIKLEVYKVWQDDEDKRPKSITIELLQDHKVIDKVKLNDDNNWRKIWNDLPSNYTYSIAEVDVPEGYKVSISQEKTVIKVINTKENQKKKKKLTKAGQLWWPLPILLILSIAFYLEGRRTRR